MKTLRWSLDEKNRPVKDVNGQFWGRRKAEAEASRRKRVKSWQKWETNPMNKDQGNYWRKGDMYVALNRCRDIFSYKDTPPTHLTGALPFWSKKAAEFFVENAKRRGVTLKEAIKQARIEYGWDEATVKESLTVQQEEPVKWIDRKEGENGEIRVRYLNPAWVEWSRKNEEEQPDSNQTPAPEPEPAEKQHLTALLRAEIEKRILRIDKMRKAPDEAIHEVQAIELTIQLVEEEK